MNLMTLIVVSIIALAMVFMAVALFYSIKLNFQHGLEQTTAKFSRYNQLPLAKLIQALGYNTREYAAKTPLHKLEKEMERCQQCSSRDKCAEDLKKSDSKLGEIVYGCPNSLSILKEMPVEKPGTSQSLH